MSENLKEFTIIDKYFKPLTNNCKAAQGLSDDVAKISLKKSQELIISKDLMVEDVHFLKEDGAFKIASKLLSSNLSDIATSGAKPLYYMLGFSKNESLDQKFIADFSAGLKESADKFGMSLIGGDTVKSSGKLFFSLTIFAVIAKNKAMLRKNAKKGDSIFISGTIGDAYLGRVLRDKNFLDRHFFPTPRIELGQELVKRNLSKCAIDVSDGLLSDLKHICDASQLTAEIYADKIPVSSKTVDLLDLISAGDDYELIFTVKKSNEEKISKLAKDLNIKISKIGNLIDDKKKPDIIVFDSNNKKITFSNYGFQH